MSQSERDFYRVLSFVNFLAFSGLATLITSFRRHREPMFQLSWSSLVAFLVGGGVALLVWKYFGPVIRGERRMKSPSPKLLPGVLGVLVVGGLVVTVLELGGPFWSGVSAAIAVVSLMMLFVVYLVRTWDLH